MVLVVKNSLASAGDMRVASLIPGSERSPGGGHGKPHQYSRLKNSQRQKSQAGHTPQGCKESDTAEHTCTF